MPRTASGSAAILALAFLTGLTQSQSAPTYQAVITSLVPPRRIPNAVALNSLQFNLSRAVGPVIAGDPAGPRGDGRLLRGERGVVPGRDRGPVADPRPCARRGPQRRAWVAAWAPPSGTWPAIPPSPP